MTFDNFVGEVQHRAHLGSLGEAVRAIRCTLGVLSQRLKAGEVKDLASQLPEEIGYYLMHSEAGQGQRFTIGEFLDRVTLCERADKPDAIFRVRAVFEVLREAVSAGQFKHVIDQLPADYAPLFIAGTQGKMTLTKKAARVRASRPADRRGGMEGIPSGRGGAGRMQPATAAQTESEKPRSSRIARRAAGAWHLGR